MDLYEIRRALSSGKTIYDLPLKVSYYTRVSTDSAEQAHSLNNQIEFFEKLIAENFLWSKHKGYVDRGLSGTSVNSRMAFIEMISDSREKDFDLILTKEVSRFARNTLDSIQYTRSLLENGVGVLFLNDNINTLESDSELRLAIMSSIAQEESRKISERVKFGFKRSIESGRVLGNSAIWGYRKEGCHLIVDEEEAAVVRDIFDLYSKNMGFRIIEKHLYSKGYRNKNGNPIGYSTISGIITNPKYMGYYCGNKSTKIDYLSKKIKHFDPAEWKIWKDDTGDTVPAIVSEELWKRCNLILQNKSNNRPASNVNQHTYSGMIKCGLDGETYWHSNYHYKNGDRTVWQCARYRKYGREACSNRPIYSDELDEIAKRILREVLDINRISRHLMTVYSNVLTDSHRPEISRQISRIKKKREHLLDLFLESQIGQSEYVNKNEQLEREIKELMSGRPSITNNSVRLDKIMNFSLTLLEEADLNAFARIILSEIIILRGKREGLILLLFILKDGGVVHVLYKRPVKSMRLSQAIHMIRVDVETEVAPIVGNEKQSEELVTFLMSEFENDPSKIWSTDIFGKSINDIVKDGLNSKLNSMPEDARLKLQETLQRMVNEGNAGMLCILL